MRRRLFRALVFGARGRAMSTRSYQDAIEKLNSLQSNTATLEMLRLTKGRLSDYAIPEMLEYLHRIGYSAHDLNALNVVHVTGTKGKGSTCAFVDSILRHVRPSWKIGLYTSPHLVAVRERIRVNGQPISEEEFAKYFFEVWDRLDANTLRANENTTPKPMYFRYLTLVAFHAFLSMNVDATILEVGIGGLHDSTNIVPKPVITGVSSLGIDHVNVLGFTLAEIAFQKAGIFKEGVPAVTVSQPAEGMTVLEHQARERKAASFLTVSELPELAEMTLGLSGAHQRLNASLAVHLASSFLRAHADRARVPNGTSSMHAPPASCSPSLLSEEVKTGLARARWPGRCQDVGDPTHPGLTWFLDGAHTRESLQACVEWYVSPQYGLRTPAATNHVTRILILNCTSGRSGAAFLSVVFSTIASQLRAFPGANIPVHLFDHVVFCANVTYADGHFKGDLTKVALTEAEVLKTQRELAQAFAALMPDFPRDNVHAFPSIEHAVNLVHRLHANANSAHALVTGSLHLVGGVIEVAGLARVALDGQ